VQYIGNLVGPVLVFGGPYSNFQATTALLEEARQRNIGPENIICTGDVVAYCADAQATVDAVRESGIHVVMGNCEESLGYDKDGCGCGFEEGSTCDLLSVQWFSHARKTLNDEAKQWMAGLPRCLTFEINNRRMAAIHGGVKDIGRFIFRSTGRRDKSRELDQLNVDGVVAGHCGLPFSENIDGRIWHNAGVIGMPANDATPRTWFSILTPAGGGVEIDHIALSYDHLSAVNRMRDENMPEDYAMSLETGLWPNMDILPMAERALKGRTLMPDSHFWSRETWK